MRASDEPRAPPDAPPAPPLSLPRHASFPFPQPQGLRLRRSAGGPTGPHARPVPLPGRHVLLDHLARPLHRPSQRTEHRDLGRHPPATGPWDGPGGHGPQDLPPRRRHRPPGPLRRGPGPLLRPGAGRPLLRLRHQARPGGLGDRGDPLLGGPPRPGHHRLLPAAGRVDRGPPPRPRRRRDGLELVRRPRSRPMAMGAAGTTSSPSTATGSPRPGAWAPSVRAAGSPSPTTPPPGGP